MRSVCALLPVPEARHGGFAVLFCYPDPEVPFVELRLCVLFCYALCVLFCYANGCIT
ncbi:hypothetical protein LOK49_LG11G01537 [Camellia lanceoleosa]|uniref:Uncharacterized protein n=1 Tax=Camellia lanceoleosa TaxID=1840588 RepID=A0ACC0G832_9ERIC|nr:hypothetical protein LOK49_LG11G01537 [Camellia lanceoleosa]